MGKYTHAKYILQKTHKTYRPIVLPHSATGVLYNQKYKYKGIKHVNISPRPYALNIIKYADSIHQGV